MLIQKHEIMIHYHYNFSGPPIFVYLGSSGYVWPPLLRVILHLRHVDNLTAGAHHLLDQGGECLDGALLRVPDVDREDVVTGHEAHHALHQVRHVLE